MSCGEYFIQSQGYNKLAVKLKKWLWDKESETVTCQCNIRVSVWKQNVCLYLDYIRQHLEIWKDPKCAEALNVAI